MCSYYVSNNIYYYIQARTGRRYRSSLKHNVPDTANNIVTRLYGFPLNNYYIVTKTKMVLCALYF